MKEYVATLVMGFCNKTSKSESPIRSGTLGPNSIKWGSNLCQYRGP